MSEIGRIWWNWQTRYFEVVVPQGVQVQVLLCAPFLKGFEYPTFGILLWPEPRNHANQEPIRMRPLFHAITVFAVSIVSLSVGNILLKVGMDRFGTLTASGIPTVQALIKVPQLPIGVVLMTAPLAR